MIDLAFTWQDIKKRNVEGSIVVVADILRATTVMVTALTNGARAILPQADETTARSLYLNMKAQNEPVLLCGERGGLKIDGFDLGNSPREFTPDVVTDHTIIHLTTNGTKALNQVKPADKILIASFLNCRAAANELLSSIQEHPHILLAASGKESYFCLEDTLCLGGIAHHVLNQMDSLDCSDAVIAARTLYQTHKDHLPQSMQSFSHAKYLASAGLSADLPVCAALDTSNLVAVMKEGSVVAVSK